MNTIPGTRVLFGTFGGGAGGRNLHLLALPAIAAWVVLSSHWPGVVNAIGASPARLIGYLDQTFLSSLFALFLAGTLLLE
ncbi:MAG: hypothetical protein ABI607_10405 [Betaproteobacteria bacterium]